MIKALALLCSPRPNGVSDAVGHLFSEGMADVGVKLEAAALRDYAISPCTGCGACANAPHNCVLAGRPVAGSADNSRMDQAEELFSRIHESSLILISSPIYFYHLPAHFKAFIDRSQRFWEADGNHTSSVPLPIPGTKPVLVALTAARPRGDLLFSGALLTLKYFLGPLDAGIRETRLLRGLENIRDLHERPATTAALRSWGHDWALKLTGRQDRPSGACPAAIPNPQ